ncbi:rod-binding protein, partial [Blastomonas sp.]|uniref:rod-binding protein n=1 Tax=Blastomonas sp. TaxID=1909299 RepID=UPI0035939C13
QAAAGPRPPLASADAAAAPDKSEAQKAELRKAAQAFEAIFLRQMISSMRTATPGDSLFGSDAGNQFRDMMDSRLADDMAGKQKFGIANMLLKQLGVDDQ